MLAQHAQRSLERAAVKTLDRIRSDQEKVSGRLRPLLEHIEVHLFDPGLDVNQLKRRCGVRDNSVPIQFHSQLGKPPHAYIEKCRLETACRLLLDTELKVWQIANLLGYSSIQVFSRAFTRWANIRPTAYRRRERRKATARPARRLAAAVAAVKTETRLGVDTLKAALDGQLEASQADRLIRRLLNLYPATVLMLDRPALAQAAAPAQPTLPPLADAAFRAVPLPAPPGPDYRRLLSLEEIETARAEALWEQIKDRPQEDQRQAIRSGAKFETRALFEVVRKGGLKQGRDDRQRGVEIAKLLRDVAESISTSSGSVLRRNLEAAAWAWVGNANKLALSLGEAEKSLAIAQDQLPSGQEDPETLGDMGLVRSSVLMYRREYEAAVREVSKALRCYELAERDTKIGQALVARGVYLTDSGRIAESAKDVERSLKYLTATGGDAYLRLTAQNLLARNYRDSGRLEEAACLLAEVRLEPQAKSDTELRLKLLWLEASIAQLQDRHSLAEEIYRNVMAGFLEKNRPAEAAAATIDLACLFWSMGRVDETAVSLRTALPALEKCGLQTDAIAGLSLLAQAASATKLTEKLVEKARASLSPSRRESQRA